jgi:NAD(P)-dependent dehydrogenase (short-subunit alcohol dehydrogenase family)
VESPAATGLASATPSRRWPARSPSDTAQQWERVLALNVTSVFLLTRALRPLLDAAAGASSDGGPSRVINIGSVAGLQHQPVPTWSYDVSKVGTVACRAFTDRDSDRRCSDSESRGVSHPLPLAFH